MCGIFGTINVSVSERANEIFGGLRHRGPDEQGLVSTDNLELLHTRLAIQDLHTTGRQPMHYQGLTVVFNGEIYNHLSLRQKYGLYAVSNSDTLSLLMLFQVKGIEILEELDGMFAFALYDEGRHELFLARDRAGKKPLYIYQNGSQIAFASELNIINQVFKPSPHLESLSAYLYLGYHYRKSTPYHEVTELENGHYLKINTQTGNQTLVKWFDIAAFYRKKSKMGLREALDALDSKLKLSINRRIDSSDLDVGSFLSGGIDSGLVTAIAALHKSSLKTFTVRVAGSYDESGLAQSVAQKYGTRHITVDISFDDLRNDIEQILINYGEPYCDSSAIPSFYVAQAAKKYVTVVLNGDGADELFAGYRRYVPFKNYDFFNSGTIVRRAANLLSLILPVAHEKQSRYNYFYRLLKFAGQADILKLYSSASSDILVGFEKEFWVKPDVFDIRHDLDEINKLPLSSLDKLLLMDFQTILFSGLLPKMDIATMAHSLEGRSPFLSKELLEFAPGLNDDFKIHGITTKFILRRLAKKYLPYNIIDQPKRGFEVPLKQWVNQQLKEIIHDYLLSSDVLYPTIIHQTFIEQLLANKIDVSEEKRAKILFNVFAMEVWHKNLKNNSLPVLKSPLKNFPAVSTP